MNNTVETNAQLLRRAQAGEADAFALLTERCRPKVFMLCLQWTRNLTDAEDLTQETLLRAFSCLEQMREPERFGAWLARIAINLCKNWRARVPKDLLPLTAAEREPEEHDVTQNILLQQAMASLSPEVRQAIAWFYLDGFSQQEIALRWRLPQSTVKGRLDAGRLRLRKEYQKMGLLPAEIIEEAIPLSRVALTDADATETKALRSALKAAGFACAVIKPEEMILSRLRRYRPDILILNMPVGALNEYDILQAVRVDQRLRGTAVMFLTPCNDEVSIFKAWNAGVNCYLTKPFTVTEVARFIAHLDRERRARDYVGLAIEYAWRKQTDSVLRCLEEAVKLHKEETAESGGISDTIHTEAAFHYLRQTPEFLALLAKLPPEAKRV